MKILFYDYLVFISFIMSSGHGRSHHWNAKCSKREPRKVGFAIVVGAHNQSGAIHSVVSIYVCTVFAQFFFFVFCCFFFFLVFCFLVFFVLASLLMFPITLALAHRSACSVTVE